MQIKYGSNQLKDEEIRAINQNVNLQMPDNDDDADNSRPPGHHHFKGRFLSLKNPSKNAALYRTLDLAIFHR